MCALYLLSRVVVHYKGHSHGYHKVDDLNLLPMINHFNFDQTWYFLKHSNKGGML